MSETECALAPVVPAGKITFDARSTVISTENGSSGSKIVVEIPKAWRPMAVQNDGAALGMG